MEDQLCVAVFISLIRTSTPLAGLSSSAILGRRARRRGVHLGRRGQGIAFVRLAAASPCCCWYVLEGVAAPARTVRQACSFWMVAQSIGLLIPFVWVFALPMGMLTATLLTFGRFSADQELTAARASGISLVSLVPPIVLLSVALSALSAWVTMDLGPRSRVAYKEILFEAALRAGTEQLPAGRFIKDFKNHIFYIRENNDGQLRDVMMFVMDDGNERTVTVLAPRGVLTPDLANQSIRVELSDAQIVSIGADGEGNRGRWAPGSCPCPYGVRRRMRSTSPT